MAVSQIEEKILGKLAAEIERHAPSLAASLYKVLGLSIMLSRRLVKARRLRKLDVMRDAKSRDLYYHIIWLAREGLSITEAQILAECQNGDQGRQCRVMAAKLRASLYHVLCLFHNYPPVTQLVSPSPASKTSPLSTKDGNAQQQSSPSKSPRNGKENGSSSRKVGKGALRDHIPSIVSDASYVTNPYAPNTVQSPPPPNLAHQQQPSIRSPGAIPPEAPRRTPTRPPGLAPLNVSSAQASASFLLPPIDFVPMAREFFQTAQDLATKLLSPCHTLRLSITLEHCAFLWDCCGEGRSARHLARQAIREVYASTEGMSDEEFADAAVIVQALGGIVRRESSGGIGSGENLQAAVREVDPASVPRMEATMTTSAAAGRDSVRDSEDQQTQKQSRQQRERRQHRRERSYAQQTSAEASQPTAAQNVLTRSSTSSPSSIPAPIDRTIAISPADHRNQPRPPPGQSRQYAQPIRGYNHSQHQYAPMIPPTRSPERLSTVHELSSGEDEGSRVSRSSAGRGGQNTATGTGTEGPGSTFTLSPPPPHPSHSATSAGAVNPSRSRSGGSLASATSDKLGKRRAVEQAEEIYRRTRGTGRAVDGGSGSSLRGGGSSGSPSHRGEVIASRTQSQDQRPSGKRRVKTDDASGSHRSEVSGNNRDRSTYETGNVGKNRPTSNKGKGRAISDNDSDGTSKRSRRRRT